MFESDHGEDTVVLVDDKSSLERFIESALTDAGLSVDTAVTAAEYLSAVDDTDVRGIVSTYDLPVLDGLQLLRSIRISNARLPFNMRPSEEEDALAGEAMTAGTSGYVP